VNGRVFLQELARHASRVLARSQTLLDRLAGQPAAPTDKPEVSINHVGLCVPNIEAFLDANAVIYGGFKKGPLIVNERQRVREMFISDGTATVELLEPMGEKSPLAGFLRQNPSGGLVHVCLECDDIDEMVGRVKAAGGMIISRPLPDVAFDERPIAFCLVANQVIEFVQRAASAPPRAGSATLGS
jgi:methylmalonyl-CoA/ethylmalonyl-CoA epimerase